MPEHSPIHMITRRRRHLFWKVLPLLVSSYWLILLGLYLVDTRTSTIKSVVKNTTHENLDLNGPTLTTPTYHLFRSSELLTSEERIYYDYDENMELISRRELVLQENRDEFLEEVLQDIQFTEVDLALSLGQSSEYDKQIEDILQGIEPGLGENGEEVPVKADEEYVVNQTMKKEAMNVLLSNRIALNRSVPDTREEICRFINYDTSDLPSMSVIIIFHNEPFTSFMRTLHSVFNRTPRQVLREVVLVDDFSDREELKGQLERYLITRFSLRKIRLIRLSSRAGLIRARMMGAHVATGDVLMFLDAHTEAVVHWAEPLLERIKDRPTAVVTPIIDVISPKTFKYFNLNGEHFYIGAFTWAGDFTWIEIPEREKMRKVYHHSPTMSPVLCGGLFAIDRKYFWEIGSYDPGMKIWGGENLELSFRIWQCGGTVEIIPCSRVGHVFREFQPYGYPNNQTTFYANTARMAKVWMDDYQKLFFMDTDTNKVQSTNIGDISKRKAFRERKKCKSFQWYLDKVYREKFRMQFETPMWGQFKNPETGQCLDYTLHQLESEFKPYTLELWECNEKMSVSQRFYLSRTKQLRREEGCAVAVDGEDWVRMEFCDKVDKSEWWEYSAEKSTLVNSRVKKCLTVTRNEDNASRYMVVLDNCSSQRNISIYQKWEIIQPPHDDD